MNKEETFLLGRISKVYGKDGAVVLHIRPDLFETIEGQKALFIGVNDYIVPYFLEWFEEVSQDELRVKFEEVDNPEAAAWFANREVYLPKTDTQDISRKAFDPDQIIGFTVTDENYGELGRVEEVIELPQHEVLKVIYKGKEVLIPIAEEIILSFDMAAKAIQVNTPEGLIELCLNN